MAKKNFYRKNDPRVRRTRRILHNALVSLILEKDYASISIKDITKRAEVAYITFFRHFESLDDLLIEALEEGLAELMKHIETLAKQIKTSALEIEGRLIFEYIEQKPDFFRSIIKSQSVTRVRKQIIRNIANIFKKSRVLLGKTSD